MVNNFRVKQGELVMGWDTQGKYTGSFVKPDKPYCVADVRYANGADNDFVEQLFAQISLENSNFNPLNSTSTNNGVQEFLFKSKFTGQNAKSQNLIYSYKTSEQTDKKINTILNLLNKI